MCDVFQTNFAGAIQGAIYDSASYELSFHGYGFYARQSEVVNIRIGKSSRGIRAS